MLSFNVASKMSTSMEED